MPFNGSGIFNRDFPPGGWQGDAANAIRISADRHDQHDADLALGLSQVICVDGQSVVLANIPFNAKKITGLADPTLAQDAATKAYVDRVQRALMGDTPPAGVPGNFWWNTSTGNLFIYYADVNSSQWVQISGGVGLVGPVGPAGETGPAGAAGPAGPASTVPGPPGDAFQRWSLSDETTPIIVSDAKVTDRFPYAYTVTGLRGSLNTPQTSGPLFTVDMKWWDQSLAAGAGAWATVLSTLLTFDNGEATSKTAAAQPVFSKTSFADDDLFRLDVTQVGDGTARGLKVTLIGSIT